MDDPIGRRDFDLCSDVASCICFHDQAAPTMTKEGSIFPDGAVVESATADLQVRSRFRDIEPEAPPTTQVFIDCDSTSVKFASAHLNKVLSLKERD